VACKDTDAVGAIVAVGGVTVRPVNDTVCPPEPLPDPLPEPDPEVLDPEPEPVDWLPLPPLVWLPPDWLDWPELEW